MTVARRESGAADAALDEHEAQLQAERQLISAVQQGDAEAFEPLYKKHCNDIGTYLLRLSGDPEHAQDLTQDTFLKAFRYIGSLTDSRQGLRPWLYTIARNTFIDSLHLRPVNDVVSLDEPDRPDFASSQRSVEDTVIGQLDARQRLQSIFATMPLGFTQSMLLHHSGYTSREAAELLDILQSTHRTRVHRSHRYIQSALQATA